MSGAKKRVQLCMLKIRTIIETTTTRTSAKKNLQEIKSPNLESRHKKANLLNECKKIISLKVRSKLES